jgi:hypothetical protein
VTAFEKTPTAVFYWALAPLAAFFGFYAAALLPNAGALHPAGLSAALAAVLPSSLACVAGIVVNWTSTLFFIMGELWGSVAISLLFWWVGRGKSVGIASVCSCPFGPPNRAPQNTLAPAEATKTPLIP